MFSNICMSYIHTFLCRSSNAISTDLSEFSDCCHRETSRLHKDLLHKAIAVLHKLPAGYLFEAFTDFLETLCL